MPKLFWRLATFAVNKRAKMVSGSFKSYLKKTNYIYYLIDDPLEHGPTAATPHNLSEILGTKDTLPARPEDLVFHEEGAKLVGPGAKTPKWQRMST